MKRIIGLSFALAVSAALLMLLPMSKRGVPVVHAQSGCSVATISGNYAVIQPSGFTTPSHSLKGAEVPWQVAGVITFDGAGDVSASYTSALNGEISTNQNSSGTYTVNSDCTGSLSFASGDAAGYSANMAIIGGATEVFGISTETGNTASWDAKKQ